MENLLDPKTMQEIIPTALGFFKSLHYVDLFPWFLFSHWIYTLIRIRPILRHHYWVLQMPFVLFCCAGGGTLTSAILGVAPPWFRDDRAFFGILLSWYLVFYSPGDIAIKVFKLPGLFHAMRLMHVVCTARSVLGTVYKTRTIFSNSVAAEICLGYLAGFGGSLAANLADRVLNNKYRPTEFEVPVASKRAFCINHLPVIPFLGEAHIYSLPPVFTMQFVQLCVVWFLLFHTLTEMFFGGPVQTLPFVLIEELFYTITRIPRTATAGPLTSGTKTKTSRDDGSSTGQVDSSTSNNGGGKKKKKNKKD